MEGMSERAYAARSGLSRGAVQKARKSGRLVLFGDGSINSAASDARRSAATDPDQQQHVLSEGAGRLITVSLNQDALPIRRYRRSTRFPFAFLTFVTNQRWAISPAFHSL